MRMMLSVLALTAAGPVAAQPLQVVVDTPITASLVAQVAGDLAQVQVLLPQGASAHHHQMRPSDARGLQDAGLLVWTGPELTPWLDRAAASVGAETPQLRLLEVPGTHLRGYGDDHGHDHDDHAHDDYTHDHGHGHDHDGTDPHAWLDPANARLWLEAIAEMLEQTDPGNADLYARNAAAADRRLADLDARIQTELAPYRDDGIVVFHDAYGYFTDHFGLRPAIAVSLGDASTPSAARLSQIRDQIAETGATCAFPEFGGDPKLVQTVIEGTPVRMGNELEPEGGMQEIGPGLYEQTLENMAAVLAECLGGEQPK
jgi:zinc transport system substrate-binding protein